MNKKVLVIEDDDSLREIISDYFMADGFNVAEAINGNSAMSAIKENEYDLILLDIMLPQIDGFSLCRQIRKDSDVPIIIITARNDEDDKLFGYELGADDYVTKPFNPRVLLAKAKNLIHRADGSIINKDKTIKIGLITINPQSYTVFVDGSKVLLSPKEYDLLLVLVENKNHVMSRDLLLSKVWGYDYYGDLRTVDTHIKQLRAKLKHGASHIVTQMKVGYKFEENI